MKPQKQDNDIWGKSENLETVVQNSLKRDINGLSANVQCSTLLSYISLLSGLWNITKEVSKPAWLRNKMKKGLCGKSKWQLTYKVQWAIRSCCWTFKTWIGQLCFNGFAPLYCESKSICDGAHLLNFWPPQLTMTFNRHDAVHVQFILSSHIVCLIYGKFLYICNNVFVLNGHLKTIYMWRVSVKHNFL